MRLLTCVVVVMMPAPGQMVPPLAAACLCLFTLAHSSSTGHATAAAAETSDDSATAAGCAGHGKQAANLCCAPDTYDTLTGQPGRCSDSDVDDACNGVQQPFVAPAAPRRRLLERLWDFATGRHLEVSGPWNTSKGHLLRVAAAASITAQPASVAHLLTALLRQSDAGAGCHVTAHASVHRHQRPPTTMRRL